MADSGTPKAAVSTRALAERALLAIATAQLLQSEYERAHSRLADAMDRNQQLRTQYGVLARELRDCISSLAHEERAAGHSVAHLLGLLREMVDVVPLDRGSKRELETDVLEWGIREFYAA